MSGRMLRAAAPLARFGAVGLLNTAVAYAVFAALLSAGLHYALATFAGGLAAVLVGFTLHGRLVFRTRDGRFGRFVGVFLATLAINVLIQRLVRGVAGGYAAGALAAAVTVPLSYLLNRTLVFAGRGDGPGR